VEGDPPLSDEVLRAIAREAADGLFVTNEALRIVWVNDRACELLERSLDEIVGHSVTDLFWNIEEEADLPGSLEQLREGKRTVTRRAFRTPRGQRRVLEVSARSVGGGLLLGIARDVTVQVAELQRMTRSEASFRALVDKSPDLAIVHTSGSVVYANEAAAVLLRYATPAALVGTSIIAHVAPEQRPSVIRRIRALHEGEPGVPFTDELLMRKDGSTFFASVGAVSVLFEGKPSVAVIARDVSDQRRLQAHLAHTEKMASIGMLAAGVAHEINNPLAYLMLRLRAIANTTAALERAIEGATQRLRETYGDAAAEEVFGPLDATFAAELRDHTTTAEEGAERVRRIVQDLRVFSRMDDERAQLIDVRVPLARALTLAAHDLELRAQVVTDLGDVPPIRATEGRLAQVFLNLLVNALHAIPEGDPGGNEVHVSTRFDQGEVQIAIRDTGVGIDPDLLPRLAEPFFTTKAPGVGTGLGLSICHTIVASLGGTIRVESEVGVGTTFTVAIPDAGQPEDVRRSSVPAPP
jgi:PAS domain S-box-containing protein